jgi:hypothetical protein
MERKTEVPTSSRDEALFILSVMHEESRGGARNAKEDLSSLRKHEQSPRSTNNSRRTLIFPPQLHANYEILTCMLEEALLCCSVSKESPRSLLELERVLDTLCETPEVSQIPVRTREVHCISRHKSRRAPFSPPQVEMMVNCPASPGKECRRPHFTSRGSWYLLDTGGETGGLVTI